MRTVQDCAPQRCGVTEKLYEIMGAPFSMHATVLSCRARENGQYAVILDRTVFFPEGGGQYADTGMLGEAQVSDVQIEGGALIHIVDRALPVGETVFGQIDEKKRTRRMQHHTAEHIISGLIHMTYGFENVGFHLSDEEMTMDVGGP